MRVPRARTLSIFCAVALLALTELAVAQHPPTTRVVDVDGIPVRVRTEGVAGRVPGHPAVVFESGASAPLETWDRIIESVAGFAPVVAYDRAGTGQTPWDGLPPTPARVGARLHRLLEQIKVGPPYVLVGHSWGGALVRYYAGAHPNDVVGLLYIDPTDITLTRADMVALFESIGAREADYDQFSRVMQRAVAAMAPPLVAEASVITELLDSDIESRALPPAPLVPTSVLVAGRVGAPPQAGMPFDTKAYARAMHERQVESLRSWVIEGGTFEVVSESGHSIHVDSPAVVIAAIQRLVQRRASIHDLH
jgi:pimeloyl-ACP methyl ester carboxylesterase